MNASVQTLLNYGKYYRIWPNFDVDHNKLYVSVALLRPYVEPICKLLMSEDYGQSWKQIADFYFMDKRNTTTGQPFVTKNGVLFVPVWSAGFYTHGETWFAIYKSENQGLSWRKVYEDPRGTYGNHFFQNSSDDSLYLGVGVGGGGFGDRVSYTPAKSYLLKSTDSGRSWSKVLKVDYPTALYSETTVDDKTVLVTAREKKSVFKSVNGGISWTEKHIGNIVRNISYFKELDRFVISSNSSIFVSTDGVSWVELKAPIKWLVLRYPTLHKEKIYMAGVVGGSFVISTNLQEWYMTFDATKVTGSNLFSRMAMADDYIFLGNELDGVLIRIKLPINENKPLSVSQFLESNVKSLISMGKFMLKSAITNKAL